MNRQNDRRAKGFLPGHAGLREGAPGSLSSCEVPGKACSFNPDILLRQEKDGRTHDIVFCFTCRQTTAGVDMSVQGAKTFFKCFCDTLPGYARLHKMRDDFEARH